MKRVWRELSERVHADGHFEFLIRVAPRLWDVVQGGVELDLHPRDQILGRAWEVLKEES